eukprot:6212446-Pleurochrysis_carterae.AAC.3
MPMRSLYLFLLLDATKCYLLITIDTTIYVKETPVIARGAGGCAPLITPSSTRYEGTKCQRMSMPMRQQEMKGLCCPIRKGSCALARQIIPQHIGITV